MVLALGRRTNYEVRVRRQVRHRGTYAGIERHEMRVRRPHAEHAVHHHGAPWSAPRRVGRAADGRWAVRRRGGSARPTTPLVPSELRAEGGPTMVGVLDTAPLRYREQGCGRILTTRQGNIFV